MGRTALTIFFLLALLGVRATLAESANPLVEGRPAPAQGMLLVADRDMRDPRFRRSVILLVRHDKDGTLGVIINRPTKLPIAHALPQIEGMEERPEVLYFGGPVALQMVSLLVRSPQPLEESWHVGADVYFTTSERTLVDVLAGDLPITGLRVLFGHAGWAPGQLEHELARGDWHLTDLDAASVFAADPESVWPELIERKAPRRLLVENDAMPTPGEAASRLGRRL